MVIGLNHITLAVADIETSLDFYRNVLGFDAHVKWHRGAYLSLADVWLCLSLDDPDKKTDYTHIAFTVHRSDIRNLKAVLEKSGIAEWKENSSEGDSLYFLDPDGHRLEVHSGDLSSRLASLREAPYDGLEWLV